MDPSQAPQFEIGLQFESEIVSDAEERDVSGPPVLNDESGNDASAQEQSPSGSGVATPDMLSDRENEMHLEPRTSIDIITETFSPAHNLIERLNGQAVLPDENANRIGSVEQEKSDS